MINSNLNSPLWSPSVSFCFITNGKKPEKLSFALESVRCLEIQNYEIIISGKCPKELATNNVTVISLPTEADNGQLGALRNAACQVAKGEVIVVSDDDMIFLEDFYTGIQKFGPNFSVAGCRVLNTDGSRYWDYAVINAPSGHHLIPYDEQSDYTYITGGLLIMRPNFFQRIQWNADRGFYKEEDVDFSKRIREGGIKLDFNRFSSAIHNDSSYYRIENRVEVRKLPARWESLQPGVFVQGAYRKIRDFFIGAREFKFLFRDIISDKTLRLSLSSFPLRDSYEQFPNIIEFYADGKEIGKAELGLDTFDLSIRVAPGQKEIALAIQSAAIPGAFGFSDPGFYGAIVRDLKIEGAEKESFEHSVAPKIEKSSRIRIIAPVFDSTELGLAIRESLLRSLNAHQKFTIESTRSDPIVTAKNESELRSLISKFEPKLEMEERAVVFHDGTFELSGNFYAPMEDRWSNVLFVGAASTIDEFIVKSIAENKIKLGVPSLECANRLIESGLSFEAMSLFPLLPNISLLELRLSTLDEYSKSVFVNLNWGGEKELIELIQSLLNADTKTICYCFWVKNSEREVFLRNYLLEKGLTSRSFSIVSGSFSDKNLSTLLSGRDVALCWNAEDPYGYFVRRIIACGVPVIGNRIGARVEISSGFVAVSTVDEIPAQIENVFRTWSAFHQETLKYREELQTMPSLEELVVATLDDFWK